MELLREQARAAAGYVPPSATGSIKVNSLPPKKRNGAINGMRTPSLSPRPSVTTGGSNSKTTATPSNSTSLKHRCGNVPGSANSNGKPASSMKGQSSQKWESMFNCLLKFIEDRKKEGTAGMADEQKKGWTWDGNVPTTFKTKDGKALG